MSEHAHQVALFAWAKLARATHPELDLLYAIPNGGARNLLVAAKLKAEGVKAGIPDMVLPVSRGGYHALYLELKMPNGKVSPVQHAWHTKLRAHGNAVMVAFGWEAAKDVLIRYLNDERI